MRIQPIVEGQAETRAVPLLLRRLQQESGVYGFEVGKPIRKRRPELSREASLKKAVQLARIQQDCAAILVVFDADDDCPKDLAPKIMRWATSVSRGIPCAVVMASREYEAWFLASLQALRGVRGVRSDAEDHPDPERPRDAKGVFADYLEDDRTYSPTVDQASLTASMDMRRAFTGCRSFRKLTSAFGNLVRGMGLDLPVWPPITWEGA